MYINSFFLMISHTYNGGKVFYFEYKLFEQENGQIWFSDTNFYRKLANKASFLEN